jgi:uncharacterized repeat protein (TIGR01451 family)
MPSFLLRHIKSLRMMATLIMLGGLISPDLILLTLPTLADQLTICAVPGKDGIGSLTGIVNGYYPGTGANVGIGSTSIPVGSINAAGSLTPIAKGDLLLVIQMQDADIDSTNTDSYGNGVAGGGNTGSPNVAPAVLGASGWTSLNNAGHYEYVVATGPISGGAIPISQGTTYAYRSSAANTVDGKRSYQVVRVPQYTTASISGTLTTAAQWNGSSGGIVVIDVKGALTFNPGSVVDVNGLGFRGGGSNPNGYFGGGSQSQSYRSVSQGFSAGRDAPKGEGIAGTPRIVSTVPFGRFNIRNSTSTTDLGVSGYPNGDEGRGAPGNAGGGGNDHNSGGGGGANGGNGGLGGRAFQGASDGYVGGFGGTAISASPTRLFLGGGGGAGDTNDQTKPSGAGGGGGGLVIIRAGTVSGSGTINSLGADGIDSPLGASPDAGGGGGAGGTVLITTASGSLSGLTINVNGGVGGDLNTNNTSETDGTGGGGGGGAVYTTSMIMINSGGGKSGTITNNKSVRNNTSNGATDGTNGVDQLISLSDLPTGISGSSQTCSGFVVSGSVFNDVSGNRLQDGTESLINGTTLTLNAVLVDSNNKVVATVPVSATGTYSFNGVSTGNYTVLLTTNMPVGTMPPTIALPLNWITTGENINGTLDSLADSQIAITVGTTAITGLNFGIKLPSPELMLLKRITKINGTTMGRTLGGAPIDLTAVMAQPDNPATPRDESSDATNPNWITNYPKGAIDAGAVKSGDLLEYTIYFMSIGGQPVTNANFCDWIPQNTTFVSDGYGIGTGIQLAIGSTLNTLTNVPDNDRGVFYNPGATLPPTYPDATIIKLNCMSPVGTDGAVVVNFVNNTLAFPENQLSKATAVGTPGNSYGFVRFVSKVK